MDSDSSAGKQTKEQANLSSSRPSVAAVSQVGIATAAGKVQLFGELPAYIRASLGDVHGDSIQ